jgi:DNA-binding NarL/FixJ family response regulator
MHNSSLPLPQLVVLIVDDSLPMRTALCDLMALSYPSSIILQAESAEQALQMVISQPPDLVLMDIALPGMDGLTCLAEILRIHPHVCSVVISYHEEQPYHQKALDAGADTYVVKRRLYIDLMPAIKNLLNLERSPR